MTQFAYIRVSTREQNVDRQLLALESFEIPKRNVYIDHQSGKDFERPAYQRMIRRMKEGDLLVVKSIDRLGRNYSEILVQWQYITKELKADIVVLDMDLLDTRKKDNNLTGTLIADLVLQIFAYVAQTEREFIHQRQAEGIAAAKQRGVQFGPKKKEVPEEFEEICEMCRQGKISIRGAANRLNMSSSTFFRKFKEESV
ncbi:MAG: recombinase family protein [Lachnospiraceae bacterium]|nr:recombinase family protein [Lachnospiraceae bacterium]